jgi:hypothetical protein
MIVNIYECVDRSAMGSDIKLNEAQTTDFWANAELVEHDAQKHPGDGWRMWEAVIEIEDLGICLVTKSYEFTTLYCIKNKEGKWFGWSYITDAKDGQGGWMDNYYDPHSEEAAGCGGECILEQLTVQMPSEGQARKFFEDWAKTPEAHGNLDIEIVKV